MMYINEFEFMECCWCSSQGGWNSEAAATMLRVRIPDLKMYLHSSLYLRTLAPLTLLNTIHGQICIPYGVYRKSKISCSLF